MTVRSYFRQLRAEDFRDERPVILWYVRSGQCERPFPYIALYSFGDYDRVVERLTRELRLSSLEVDESFPYSSIVRTYKLPSADILR